jgi:hypothetical protein
MGQDTSQKTQVIRPENLMSFSPADISVYMANIRIGTLLSISYSISREVIGLFSLGDANAVGFNRGKRGIAGSLVFNQFQDHPLLHSSWANSVGLDGVDSLVGLSNTAITQNFQATVTDVYQEGDFRVGTNPSFAGGTFSSIDQSFQDELNSTYKWVANRAFRYVDQIPPFDIVLTFVNEMGDAAVMSINSVILANEGGGFSIDDITSEVAITYIARSITPLRAFMPNGTRTLSNVNKGFNVDGIGSRIAR